MTRLAKKSAGKIFETDVSHWGTPFCKFRLSQSLDFTATPSKIKTVQWINSGIWEIKGGKFAKNSPKFKPVQSVSICEIRVNDSPKFTDLFMETPCWCLLDGHQQSGWKPTEISVTKYRYGHYQRVY